MQMRDTRVDCRKILLFQLMRMEERATEDLVLSILHVKYGKDRERIDRIDQRHCPVQSQWGSRALVVILGDELVYIFLHRDLFPDAEPYWLHSNCCVYVKLNLWWTISTTLDPIYLRSQTSKPTSDDGYVQAYNSGSIPFHARGPDVL
jgi:hypothetical protein